MVQIPPSLSDHPSLVGIVRFPNCNYTTHEIGIPLVIQDGLNPGSFINITQLVDMADVVTGSDRTSQAFLIPKASVTDFFPYTYYVLTDGESEPLIMYPQYMPPSLIIKGKFALSHQPIERYFPVGYKGDDTGTVYNITNLNQMMLPTATNEGISYMNANANTIMQTRKSQVTGNILNGVTGVASAVTGFSPMGAISSVGNVINGINEIKNTDARNKDMFMTPNSISSFGTPSTRNVFNTNKVRLLRYSVNSNVKTKINNFCSRYGNKYNNYATINLKTYKGYLKMISPNIDSSIDNIYVNKIREILERGVYIE